MSEGSVLAHVTEANDEADKGDAPLSEQNGALPRTPPKELSSFGILQSGAFFVVRRVLNTDVLGAQWGFVSATYRFAMLLNLSWE